MGSSCSRGGATVASSTSSWERDRATAKLVLPDGELQEFSWPVKASHVLQKESASFICHSDTMNFDGPVSAVGADDLLRPGNLYFVLPLRSLHRPLSPAEMATLAAKASSALSKKGYGVLGDDGDDTVVDHGRNAGTRRKGRSELDTIQEGKF